MSYRYRAQILTALAAHGIRPTSRTPPTVVHELVNDLYRYELRRLRARQVRGEIAKRDYSASVVELRKRYLLVSVPLRLWTEPDTPSQEGETEV